MPTDQERLTELENQLRANLKSAHEAAAAPLSAEEITKIVQQIVSSLSGDLTTADLKFYSELRELATYIQHAKLEIAAIKPKDISTNYIPTATDELDAVVGATEEATNKIMDVCDQISSVAESCTPEQKEQLIGCTTRIFEACNFQDITGQRITKVVQTLKYIDGKVAALLTAMGEEIGHNAAEDMAMTEADEEKALMNGPQLPQNAIDQDAIDRLLSGN